MSRERPLVWATVALTIALLATPMRGAAPTPGAPVDDRRLPNGQTIAPVGDLLVFPGRPVDVRVSVDGKLLFVKDRSHVRVVSTSDFTLRESLDCPGGASLYGMAVGASGRVYVSGAGGALHVYAAGATPKSPATSFRLERSIALAADSFPCGLALSSDERFAYVCLSKANQLAEVRLADGKVLRVVDTGVAPFDVAFDQLNNRAYVTNAGGRRPTQKEPSAPSAGTATVIDERGVASSGTISVIDVDGFRVVAEPRAGLQPSVIALAPGRASVVSANANDDSLTVVRSDTLEPHDVIVKPDVQLPYGSMPSSVAFEPTTGEVAVALAGNNCVAFVGAEALAAPGESLSPPAAALLPTAWYPTAVAFGSDHLYVACAKGTGSRDEARPVGEGRNSHDHQGVVQRIPLKDLRDPANRKAWDAAARAMIGVRPPPASVRAAGGGVATSAVPERLGEPSSLRHVVYVIKENRTYDQVFGDIEGARGEPALCTFPEKLSPNHHALARRFGVLDNYYCNGVLSADGHSWATEGNVTPYLERAFGGFARSYTFGDDPITYSSSGFVWDHVLAAGLSFRNYGEMDYAEPPAGFDLVKLLAARDRGERVEFEQKIGVDRLRRYSCRDYPGWNMEIPDVLRVDRFLDELRRFEHEGELPNLSIVYLPQDHFGGSVTSQAHMVDNDLALGRLVEGLSESRFWKHTAVFVNEDDPQGGYDHIDGHRSICLVVSPYSRGGVNHDFFNQTSVLRTILHIFGLPPMNQRDAASPLMASCFDDSPDFSLYKAIVPETPLDQRPKPLADQSTAERQWRAIAARVPIQRTGMKTARDEDNLNRFVWHEVRGWRTPYPAEHTGPHGRGLKDQGLSRRE
ncbi:MAG: bifunctional YncE family protein/alkaline phosphatase family protein [Lacipirellulaceae bacterium]